MAPAPLPFGDYLLVERLAGARNTFRAVPRGPAEATPLALKRLGAATGRRLGGALPDLFHVNLAAPLGWGRVDGEGFLASRFCTGHGLDRLLRGGPLPATWAVFLVVQAARGIAHLHARSHGGAGLLHRRLSPRTLVVGGRGEVAVCGLEDAVAPGPRRASPPAPAEESAFVAPEQRLGEPLDPRADVFSLGAILVAALGEAAPAGELAALIARACASSRTPRFRDGRALAAALAEWLARQPPIDGAALAEMVAARASATLPASEELLDDGEAIIARAGRTRPGWVALLGSAADAPVDERGQVAAGATLSRGTEGATPVTLSRGTEGATPVTPSRGTEGATPVTPSRGAGPATPVTPSRGAEAAILVTPSHGAGATILVTPSRGAEAATPVTPSRGARAGAADAGTGSPTVRGRTVQGRRRLGWFAAVTALVTLLATGTIAGILPAPADTAAATKGGASVTSSALPSAGRPTDSDTIHLWAGAAAGATSVARRADGSTAILLALARALCRGRTGEPLVLPTIDEQSLAAVAPSARFGPALERTHARDQVDALAAAIDHGAGAMPPAVVAEVDALRREGQPGLATLAMLARPSDAPAIAERLRELAAGAAPLVAAPLPPWLAPACEPVAAARALIAAQPVGPSAAALGRVLAAAPGGTPVTAGGVRYTVAGARRVGDELRVTLRCTNPQDGALVPAAEAAQLIGGDGVRHAPIGAPDDAARLLSAGATRTLSADAARTLSAGATRTLSADAARTLSADAARTLSADAARTLSAGATRDVELRFGPLTAAVLLGAVLEIPGAAPLRAWSELLP